MITAYGLTVFIVIQVLLCGVICLFFWHRSKKSSALHQSVNAQASFSGLEQALTDLANEKKKLDAILELAADPIICSDSYGNIFSFNRAAEELFGYTKEEILGKNVKILTPPDIEKIHDGYVAKARLSEHSGVLRQGRELQAIAKDGSYYDINLSLSAVDLGQERIFVGVVKDVSRLVALASELARSNSYLEAFAYSASHDLQEPLRTMSSYSRFLLDDLGDQLSDDHKEDLQFIFDASLRLKSLVEALLAYSRIGRRGAEKQWINTNQLIASIQKDLIEQVNQRCAEFEISSLPKVFGVEIEIRSVFLNLIVNALKYSTEPPRIKISGVEKSGKVEFLVVDNGQGIPDEYQEKVFEVFRRLDTSQSGSGIGLASCKKIVQMHGGEISVSSELGRGSSFKFSFSKPRGSERSQKI